MYFYSFEGLGCNFAGVSIVFFLMIALLAPMILALVLNSYMHSKKASDVYHAIPVSRGTLLTANAAVGMTIVGFRWPPPTSSSWRCRSQNSAFCPT